MLNRLYKENNTKTYEEAVIASSLYSGDSFATLAKEIKRIIDYEAGYTRGYKPSPEQYRSILSQADRMLIDACPGSGKTTTMIFKIMVDTKVNNFKYGDQLVLTYTSKAAEDMNKKYEKLCSRHGVEPNAEMYTIHSYAHKMQSGSTGLDILTEQGKTIEIIKGEKKKEEKKKDNSLLGFHAGLFDEIDDDDDDLTSNYEVEYKYITEVSIYLEVLKELGLSRVYYTNCNQLPQWINTIVEGNIRTEEELLSIELFSEIGVVKIDDLWRIEEAARRKRMTYGVVNFTDMLLLFYTRLKNAKTLDDLGTMGNSMRIKYLYIDEVQDISQLQWDIFMEILRLNPECKLLCVGDTDQSIFSFRGSTPEFITNFEDRLNERDFNDGKTLDIMSYTINRRSSKSIINLATNFIRNNQVRMEKQMRPISNPEGTIKMATLYDKTSYVDTVIHEIKEIERQKGKEYLDNIAILYREHKQGMRLVRQMIREGILVKFPGELGINMSETDDVIGIMNMINNPTNYTYVKEYLYKSLSSINKSKGDFVALKVREEGKPFTTYINAKGPITKELNNLRQAYVLIQQGKITAATKLIISNYLKAYLNLFPNRIWKLDEVQDVMEEYEGCNYNELVSKVGRDKMIMKSIALNNIGISALTFHSSKGLEFERVYILPISDKVSPKIDIADKMIPSNREKYIEEERRLLYVAMTRSKSDLTVYFGDGKSMFPTELREAKIATDLMRVREGVSWE